MAYSLVCQKHRVFTAIANVIGTMSADDWQGCEPDADVSILHIHGAKDNVVPINGGGFLSSAPSVTKVIAYWAKTLEAQTIANTNFNSIYSAQRYRNKHTGAEINYFLLNEFGHDWPHRKNSQFSAVDIVAEFFARLANQDKGKITMGKNASVAPYQMHGHLHAYKH